MTALIIVLSVVIGLLLLVALLILFGSARIRISYAEQFTFSVSLFGFPIPLPIGKEEKEKKKRDLTNCKSAEKILQKELRKQKKRLERLKKKQEKKKKKKKALPKPPTASKKKSFPEKLEELKNYLHDLRVLLHGGLSIEIRRMRIAVATGDAASTALLYGAVSGAISSFLGSLEAFGTNLLADPDNLSVFPDYTASKFDAEVDIICSLRLRNLLLALFAYWDTKNQTPKGK